MMKNFNTFFAQLLFPKTSPFSLFDYCYIHTTTNLKKKEQSSSYLRNFLTALFVIFMGIGVNAQSAGTVSSNSDQLCVGSSAEFWSTGWGGGTWSSSNSSVLKVEPSGSNARAIGVSRGTADVIYTLIVNSNVYTSKKTITVSNQLGAIGEISGAQPQCANTSTQIYSVSPVANATSYQWKVPSDWTITSGGNTNSITVTVGASNGNLEVQAFNACASSTVVYKFINVLPRITAVPVATGATNIQCMYAQLNWNTVSNADGYRLDIATNSSFTEFVPGYNNFYVDGNNSSKDTYNLPAGILYYRVRATNPCTTTTNSNTVSFRTSAPEAGSVSSSQSICSGASASIRVTGSVGSIQWQQSANGTGSWSDISGATSASYTTPNLTQNTYYRVVVNNGNCAPATSSSILVSVNQPATVGVMSNNQSICSGNSSTISVTGSVGSIQWQQSANGTGSWSDISGATSASYTTPNLTQNTYYRVVVKNGICSATNSNAVLISVNQNITISTQPTALSAYCQNTTSSTLFVSASGAVAGTITYQWYSNTSNSTSGGTLISGATSANYSPSTTSAGSQFYYVIVKGSCGSAISNVSTVNVTPVNTVSLKSMVTTNIQQICASTAIAPITYQTTGANGIANNGVSTGVNGLPAGVSAVWFNNTITISGRPIGTGTFNYTIPLSGGCGNVSATGTIKVGETSTYGTEGWSNGVPQNNGLNALFDRDYSTVEGSVYACNCTINANKKLTVAPNTSLTVINSFVNNGSVLIQSEGNFIQVNNLPQPANSGNIISEREFKIGAERVQYNYLGSPVAFEAGQTFKTIFPGSTNTTVLYHNQTTNTFSTSSGANVPGRGSAVKEPPLNTVLTNGKSTAQFKGTPQNGEITLAIANKDLNVTTFGYNLMGNPYASNIDLRKLYDLNGGKTDGTQITSLDISPTFYFWDNNKNQIFQQQGSGYGGQSYALFNVLTGPEGTGTAAGSLNGGAIVGTKKPTKIVKVGQGFMTRSLKGAYDFKFNNSIRTPEGSTSDFLGKNPSTIPTDRYWLQMTAPSGITSTIAVVHYEGGNDAFGAEDSRTMGGSDALFSLIDTEKAAINGRSAFRNTDKIPLGTTHFVNGIYKIGIDTEEGIFSSGQRIYLKDQLTGTVTNLSEGDYSFTTDAGEMSGRFEIIYKPETVLATAGSATDDLVVYRDQGDFIVRAKSKQITALEVYDVAGRMIYSIKPKSTTVTVAQSLLVNGTYILRIDQNGQITTKKVIR